MDRLNNAVSIIRTLCGARSRNAAHMTPRRLACIVLLLVSCGRGALEGPRGVEGPAPVAPAPGLPGCVADRAETSLWACETVSALEIVSLAVSNDDGSTPWSGGRPLVSAVMRNTSGKFLNYPGIRVDAAPTSLQQHFASNALYGLGGCGEAQISMAFEGMPSGTSVTFTAFPVHISSDTCPLSHPPMTLTVVAP